MTEGTFTEAKKLDPQQLQKDIDRLVQERLALQGEDEDIEVKMSALRSKGTDVRNALTRNRKELSSLLAQLGLED